MRTLCVVACFVASLSFAPQGVHSGKPPDAIQRLATNSYLQPTANLRATVSLDCEGKSVTIMWRYSSSGDFASPEATETQTLAVSYWPTCGDSVAATKLLIAGKARNGDTIIERWSITPPLVHQLQSTGGYYLEVQRVAEVEAVYDAAVAGRDMVRTILRLRGKPTSALVQFYDSNELYEIDWNADGYPLSQVLSETVEPALAKSYDCYRAGDHSVLGYVYMFSDVEGFFSVPALVLVDSNRDGVIDSHQTMTFAQYHAAALNNQDAFVELNGLTH